MYGQPTAVFKMLGTVKNQSGKPVKGIRVVIAPDNNPWEYDTLYTDASGRFEKDRLKHSWPDELKYVTVRFEDVDGAENGSYRTKELKRSDIQVKQTDKGKGAWFQGSFTATADAVLDEEK
jgi:putative lipoprotein (rSAM/lipoprotein system)